MHSPLPKPASVRLAHHLLLAAALAIVAHLLLDNLLYLDWETREDFLDVLPALLLLLLVTRFKSSALLWVTVLAWFYYAPELRHAFHLGYWTDTPA